jgi:Fe-S-cluster containining protein
VDRAVTLDCHNRLHLCRAKCCYPGGKRCQFLGDDLRCTIYDDRPQVCRTFSCETRYWHDFENYKIKEDKIEGCGGCGGRLRKAMARRGWKREGAWWTHPDGHRLHDDDVTNKHTQIALEDPALAVESAKVIAEEVLAKSKSIARRLGVL